MSSFPQSGGEFLAQELYGSRERADRFYRDQMLDVLTPQMVEFLGEQTEMVVASVDTEGHPDVSIRFGEPGFVGCDDFDVGGIRQWLQVGLGRL